MVLLDTSAWILVLRKNPPDPLKRRVEQLLKENSIAVMPIVKVELLGGTRTEGEFERLNRRLEALEQLDLDSKVWNEASVLAYRLRRTGITIPYTDIIIAALALHHNATIMHSDKHFTMIASNTPLMVESI